MKKAHASSESRASYTIRATRASRAKKLAASFFAALLIFQSSPVGIYYAYADEESGELSELELEALEQELAAMEEDYPDGAFGFYETEGSGTEGDGDIAIQVVRMGGTSQAATVDVVAVNLTAFYEDDYIVYYYDGNEKVILEDVDEEQAETVFSVDLEEALAAGLDELEQVVEETEDFETTSALRTAYTQQTGEETVNTNWRGEYESYIASVDVSDGANEIANVVSGSRTTLSFDEGESVKTLYVEIIDDDKAEVDEAFKLLLGNATVGQLSESMQCNFTIYDNEEPETIVFAMKDAEVVVEEGAEYAEVTILRQSGLHYYAGAVVRTASGTATSSDSYTALDGVTVAFSPEETEQTIQIELADDVTAGTYFTVTLDTDSNYVEEGSESTVVWLGGQNYASEEDTDDDTDASVEEAILEAAQNETVEVGSSSGSASSDGDDSSTTSDSGSTNDGGTMSDSSSISTLDTSSVIEVMAETVDGVVYDTVTYSLSWSNSRSGVQAWCSVYATYSAANQATMARLSGSISGYTSYWIFGKNSSKKYYVYVGEDTVVSRSANSTSTLYYTDYFDLNWSRSQSGKITLMGQAQSINYNVSIAASQLVFYYPRYTLNMASSDASQTLTGKNYTSTDSYTTFDVSALSGSPSWNTKTVSRNGSTDLTPGSLSEGVSVDYYELYVGSTKVYTLSGSSSISYSTLNSLRANYDTLLRDNRYQITVKPVYTSKAATVTFESEDASAIGFSGDSSSSGFKVGDTLTCTLIDRVTFTATCTTDQEVEVESVARYSGSNYALVETLEPQSDAERLSFTQTISVKNEKETLKVFYQELSLTFEYTPSEASASNADAGTVLVYDSSNLDEPLGASVVGEPLAITGTLALLRNSYIANVVAGDGFETIEMECITFNTETIWTYRDSDTGQYKSTRGNSLVYKPYYANEVVNYHFKLVQQDENQVGVSGTVYIDETPLFSGAEKVTSTEAVGVTVSIGGSNTTSANDGSYSIDPQFNKGDYVAAFLMYDTLIMMTEVAISQDTKQDFHINVNESEDLTVTDSVIYKKVDTGTNDMSNNAIYEQEEVSSVLLEDTEYTFTLTAQGSAGVTPAYAEFYFYDKNGDIKPDATQTVEFDGNVAELVLNPMEANLAVGDSMTVKLYDTEGVGYFEHQSDVIIGEKLDGMYSFNYTGVYGTDHNSLFLTALGGYVTAYDFVLDALSSDGGTYTDSDGNQHQLVYIGFGSGFSSSKIYDTMQEAIADIQAINAGDYNFDRSSSIKVFSSNSWAINVEIGIIYDSVLQTQGDRKGEYMFSDYLILADFGLDIKRQWNVNVSIVTLTFTLQFNVGNTASNSDVTGIKWHFYNADDEEYYVNSSSAVMLLDDGNLDSEGIISLSTSIKGALGISLYGVIGVEGSLTVGVNNTVAYEGGDDGSGWKDYGTIVLEPAVKLKILGVPIPLWSDDWKYTWTTATETSSASAMSLLQEEIDSSFNTDTVLYTSTSTAETLDYSYTKDRSAWSSGGAASSILSIFMPSSAEAITETVLQDGFLSDSEIAVEDLGDGRYLAVFLDVVDDREDVNNTAAYWTLYNGSSWSTPQLIATDDGTADQLPTICDAGDLGYLVVWSNADHALTEDEDLVDRLNSFDLVGCFFDPVSGTMGDLMEITKTTDEDNTADTMPQVTYFTDDSGEDHMMIYYTKSEYDVTSEEEGEVVGDLLNPYQLIAVREYDFDTGTWSDSYSETVEQEIKDYLLESGATESQLDEYYEQYLDNWYGQQFLNLYPSISISEELDDMGYWVEGTTAQISENDSSQAIVRDNDSIAYNGLSLLAYSLDMGGMEQVTGDQYLYLQIYNGEDEEFHHPIQISTQAAEISDVQFVRTQMYSEDGSSSQEVTWLYWKEIVASEEDNDTQSLSQIKRINISSLVSQEENLIKGETSDGQEYYYINKDSSNDSFDPETVIVTSSTNDDSVSSSDVSIGNFVVKSSTDGLYNYIVWTEGVTVETEDGDLALEQQLFVSREDTQTGEISLPVQVTDTEGQYVDSFDVAITSDGNLDVLAVRKQMVGTPVLDDEGNETGVSSYEPDDSTSELVFWHITPSDEIYVGDVVQGAASVNEEGQTVVSLSTELVNDSFLSYNDVVLEVVDSSGNVVYRSDQELSGFTEITETATEDGGVELQGNEASISVDSVNMLGGAIEDFELIVPVDENGSYSVTIRVLSDGEEVASKAVSGTVPVYLETSGLTTEILERHLVRLTSMISNSSVLDTGERDVAYGYIDADGNKVELGRVTLDSLACNESTEFSVDVEIDFADFESTYLEDGSLVCDRQFYLDLDPDGLTVVDSSDESSVTVENDNTATIVYSTVELSATAAQVSLIESLGELSATFVTYDDEAYQVAQDTLEVGESTWLGLLIDGELAQNVSEYTNGLKVVWDEVDNDLALVTSNGVITARSEGTITLTGLLMPADTASNVYANGASETVDNYSTLPEAMIIPITVTLSLVAATDDGDSDDGSDSGDEGTDTGDEGTGDDSGDDGSGDDDDDGTGDGTGSDDDGTGTGDEATNDEGTSDTSGGGLSDTSDSAIGQIAAALVALLAGIVFVALSLIDRKNRLRGDKNERR